MGSESLLYAIHHVLRVLSGPGARSLRQGVLLLQVACDFLFGEQAMRNRHGSHRGAEKEGEQEA